ncbi:asparaginase domain-containing protein [Desulfonatronovibrio hydrogenovorans]|uniref:asparaginase domain-containing protein n=1 Tax=Desulfonatronovibrio hydrogenovorans TaxID=53245 RepID=UPI00048B603C|nr:asparaginase domain-containing protein [Desulfonatronovibrio hydrogenovorans]
MLKIFITGGTLDKEYRQTDGELILSKTHVNEILGQGNCTLETGLEIIMLKDSLFMEEQDRKIILEKCLGCPEKQIVITHGTDTMAETARVLGPVIKDKTVVLVGAMIPFTFRDSDAVFNLGFALAAVQILKPGIYIAMNARIFAWDNVRKNKESGEFEKIRS